MEEQELTIIESLVAKDEELAVLWREHQEFERLLEGYNTLRYLSPEEEVERKRLQKLKLAGRDRIEAILAQHRTVQGKK